MLKYYALRENNHIYQGVTTLHKEWLKDFLKTQQSLLLFCIPTHPKSRYNYEVLAFLFQHLGQLLTLGIPLLTAFHTLSQAPVSPTIHIMCYEISYRLRIRGETLSDAFRSYGHIFPAFVLIHMRIGEGTGNLANTCIHLSGMMSALHKQRLARQKIYHYLSLVGGGVVCAIITLINLMDPFLRDIYKDPQRAPSVLTSGFLYVASVSFYKIVVLCFGCLRLCGILFRKLKGSLIVQQYGRQCKRYWGRKVALIRLRTLHEFWFHLSAFLQASLPLSVALHHLQKDSFYYASDIQSLICDLHNGLMFSESLAHSDLGSAQVNTLIQLGESEGDLRRASHSVAEYIHMDMVILQKKMMRWIQPLGLLLISILLIVVIYATFIPIYNLTVM